MSENRPALVEEVIDAELDAALHDPAEGAVMVVRDTVHEEGAVEPVLVDAECVVWETRWVVCTLEDGPDFVQREGRVLEGVLVAKGVET